jgi:hypothetical protein
MRSGIAGPWFLLSSTCDWLACTDAANAADSVPCVTPTCKTCHKQVIMMALENDGYGVASKCYGMLDNCLILICWPRFDVFAAFIVPWLAFMCDARASFIFQCWRLIYIYRNLGEALVCFRFLSMLLRLPHTHITYFPLPLRCYKNVTECLRVVTELWTWTLHTVVVLMYVCTCMCVCVCVRESVCVSVCVCLPPCQSWASENFFVRLSSPVILH